MSHEAKYRARCWRSSCNQTVRFVSHLLYFVSNIEFMEIQKMNIDWTTHPSMVCCF
ncbi:hypothetical protein HanIR_Chr17g0851031 [Helianthus annuus]|nr:hypothetical protein HanIR_Chr17g0851031 [Helianthus annuus]